MVAKRTILAICAHNDDQVIGAGGTLAKYAKEGYRVRTIILSFGEASHPHLRREVIVERRIKESLKSDKIIGGAGVAYFGLKEGRFEQEVKEKRIPEKIAWIIQKEKPAKIFTHGLDDAHPDHGAVYRMIMQLMEEKKIKCAVYSFDIWSLIKLRKRYLPKLVVGVDDTFKTKLKAILAHKSQKLAIALLLWKVVLKDWLSGFVYGYHFAEVFYKLR
jgi:LmbE family N-acetylglucosaminyl deacetylase